MGLPLKTKKFDLGATAIYVPVEDIVNYIIVTDGTHTVDVHITLENFVVAEGYLTANSIAEQLIFADVDPDTITRTVGSWNHEHFVAGMTITVAGTASNDDTYTIATVTDKVITLVGGDTLVDETIALPTAVTVSGLYSDTTIWALHQSIAVDTEFFEALEYGPTAFKFTRTAGASTVPIWVRG